MATIRIGTSSRRRSRRLSSVSDSAGEMDDVKPFDEFLETRFPESPRKACYLMSIHEHLPPQALVDIGRELVIGYM